MNIDISEFSCMKFIIHFKMCGIKYLILVIILFVGTSCEVITNPIPVEIPYTSSNKINIVLSLINIHPNVVRWNLNRITDDAVTVVKNETKTTNEYIRGYLHEEIERDQNYSVKLWKADGSLCNSTDVVRLITDDLSGRESNTHKCMNKETACHIQIDFDKQCDNGDPVVKILSPTRYEDLSFGRDEKRALHLNENENLILLCDQNRLPDYGNLTWHQEFPFSRDFQISQQLLRNVTFMLNMTVQWFDDGSTLYCTGVDGEISAMFILRIIEPNTERETLGKTYYNENNPVTRNCEKGKKLLQRTFDGIYKFYMNIVVKINEKKDNGSLLFCMRYRKINHARSKSVFKASREIYEEIIYIYEENLKTGFENVAVWVVSVIIGVVVISGGIFLVWYKRCRIRNRPEYSKEHIYETPAEVVYAEINTVSCTSDTPNPVREEPPYAKIIGVLGPKNASKDVATVTRVK